MVKSIETIIREAVESGLELGPAQHLQSEITPAIMKQLMPVVSSIIYDLRR